MNHKLSSFSQWVFWSIAFVSLFFTSSAFADSIDPATMLDNFSLSIPNLMRLVTATGYVLGMYFVYKGILELKQYGESRTMMSREHALSGPLLFLVSGTCLLYLPSSVQVGMHTFWQHPTTPYAYLTAANSSDWSSLITAVYLLVGLVGTIAIIRGIVQMSKLHSQGQQNALGRCLTHIIGGIFCVNLYQFLAIINYTLGLSQ